MSKMRDSSVRRRSRGLALVCVLTAGVLPASACGDDEPEATSTTAEPDDDEPEATSTTAEPDDDEPEATSTTAEPDGDESGGDENLVIYGIDLTSVMDLPEAESYEDYEVVEDDTQQVEVAVPTEWDDVDTRTAERDGEEIPGVWASTDLEALDEGYTVPGVQIDLRTADSDQDVLDLLDADNATDEACEASETFDYDDGLFTGTAELWTGCGESGTGLLQVAAHRGEDKYVSVEIQMLTSADVEAAVEALAAFNAVEVGAVPEEESDDTTETTEDKADALPGDESADEFGNGDLVVIEFENGYTSEVDPDEPVFSIFDGSISVITLSDYWITAPNGPEDQWRISEVHDLMTALDMVPGVTSDGATRYFPIVASVIGTGRIVFENCPGCPEGGGQPVRIVELEVENLPND